MTAAQSRHAEAAGQRQPSRVDYNAFIGSLSLAAINLVAIGGERREPGEASKTRYELSAGYQIEETSIHYRFDAHGHLTNDEATDLGDVRASVIVTVGAEAIPDEQCIERFGNTSALMMAYPYLREALASTAQRLGFSGVLLPLRTHTPPVDRPDEASC